MGRPPKYNWEPIDRLIAAGVSAGEIAKKVGAPRQSIDNRIRRHAQKTPQTQTPFVVKVSEDTLDPTQTPLKLHSNSTQIPVTPNTPSELAEIAAQNQALQWLDRIDKTEKNNMVLATVLQSRIGRYLERNPDLRACDIAHIASSLSTLETLGKSKDELGTAIQTFMKLGLFDKKTSAYLAQAVVGDRDASLTKLRRIVQGGRSSTGTEAPSNTV